VVENQICGPSAFYADSFHLILPRCSATAAMCLFPSYVLPVRLVSDLRRPGKPKVAFFLSEFSYPLIKKFPVGIHMSMLYDSTALRHLQSKFYRFSPFALQCSHFISRLPSPSPSEFMNQTHIFIFSCHSFSFHHHSFVGFSDGDCNSQSEFFPQHALDCSN
jgi:hypothetical protein